MSGIDQALLDRLREQLLKCDEFHNPGVLYAVMGSDFLSPWQTGLPSADSVSARVDLTINYLADKRHINGKGALVLLLEVLAKRYAVQDERRQALLGLVSELQRVGTAVSQPTPVFREERMDQKTRNMLLDIFRTRISPSELRELAFIVLEIGAYDNLAGSTHTEKSISFLETIERRQMVSVLFSKLKALRPDIALPSLTVVQPDEDDYRFSSSLEMLTWLHLSDLHFRESSSYEENIVLKPLLRDVTEHMQKDDWRPDFIVVTGDLAFSGKPAEYALARNFLDKLLKITNLPRERLFVVPGNHDVDRSLITRGAKAMTDALLDRNSTNAILADDTDRALVMRRFEGYARFVNDYFGGHITFDDKQYFHVHSLTCSGSRVMLMGLNSAWVCASDADKTSGVLLGERQVRAAVELAETGDLKIALLHHPFDWLREFEQNNSAAILLEECDFILRGHLHRTAATQLSNPDASAMVIDCGACYESRQHPNMYNLVRLDLKSRTGTVYFRRYSDQGKGFWAKDVLTYKNAPDGEYAFRF